ncbi:hypothetical protein GCM10017778_32210 [Streptomyces vinaceus]|nr:hypothetical protein GCM10017778_32210 [Streptomyces vinaceus]
MVSKGAVAAAPSSASHTKNAPACMVADILVLLLDQRAAGPGAAPLSELSPRSVGAGMGCDEDTSQDISWE